MKLIEARGPGIKLPTIAEMCALFDLSRTPLENAIRAIETRGLLRRRRGSGIYVTDRVRQKTIGVVFGGNIFSASFSPYWSLMLQAVRVQAGERKHRALAYLDITQVGDGLGGHAQLVEDLGNRRIHGLLLLAPDTRVDESAQLQAGGVPLVVLGGLAPNWRVTIDWSKAVSMAARELAKAGCRRIAVMTKGDVRVERELTERALCAVGIRDAQMVDWSWAAWSASVQAESHEQFGYEVARRHFETTDRPRPDGLICTDDTMTRGVLSAMERAGFVPGCDMRIVTGANKGSPVLQRHEPDLILMEHDPAATVRAALNMLETLMNGGTPPRNPVRIAPELRRGPSPALNLLKGAEPPNVGC